ETFSELYSHSNRLGLRLGMPMTRIYPMRNSSTAAVSPAAMRTSQRSTPACTRAALRLRLPAGNTICARALPTLAAFWPPAAVISDMVAAHFHKAEAEVDEQDENEQHDAGGDERFAVEAGGVAHLDDDVGGHRAQALEQPLRHP